MASICLSSAPSLTESKSLVAIDAVLDDFAKLPGRLGQAEDRSEYEEIPPTSRFDGGTRSSTT